MVDVKTLLYGTVVPPQPPITIAAAKTDAKKTCPEGRFIEQSLA
jgi:hypothetical protein